LTGKVLDCRCFPRIPANRLLAEDMLSSAGRVTDDFEMQVVRRSNIHNFDVWIFDNSPPIGRLFLETKSTPGCTGPSFDVVCANDESWVKRTFRKAFDDLPIGSAVHLTHPTHANDANSYDTRHSFDLLCSSRTWLVRLRFSVLEFQCAGRGSARSCR
jgi:hypothetical protein